MTVPEQIYKKAIEQGFTVEAACGLLANIQAESAFRADNAEDRINGTVSDAEYIRRADADLMTYNGKNFIYDAVGFGYIQWTYWSRKKGLLEYCKGHGKSVADSDTQIDFIFVEMKRDFPGIWSLCQTCTDLSRIMHQLIGVWENPADHVGAMNTRFPYAQAWLAKFNDWSDPDTNPPEQKDTDDEGIVIDKTWPPRMINEGLNWKETYLLQALLNCHGYNIVVNGIFSSELKQKVIDFQAKNGLDADGVVGPKTWKKLMELPQGF